MHPPLSFEQAPPISVPFRFFLTAPLFGVAAGLLLAVQGEGALASRWTPEAFALTHLLAAGYMLQAMCGALLQFVPVAAGGNVWRPRWVAGFVHPAITLATLMLVAAFLSGRNALFPVAATLFALGLGVFILVVSAALMQVKATTMTLHALRLSLIGLMATALAGIVMTLVLSGWSEAPLLSLLDVHLAWGLGGWSLMLVIGVSYLVVPMFQLTPPYPVRLTRVLPLGLLLGLVIWSARLFIDEAVWWPWLGIGLSMATALTYAIATLWLQAKRRRRVTDPTLILWRGAMVAILALTASLLLELTMDDLRLALLFGVLALVGVFVSAINGMLYKIVPFLNWLHLQQIAGMKVAPPNMRKMISERAMRGQAGLHFAALALLLASVPWPVLTVTAGLAFAASCAWLEWNLIGAVRVFHRHLNN